MTVVPPKIAPEKPQLMGGPTAGIFLIIGAMFCISINDVLIKSLSGDYPLHQIVMVRSSIGLMISLVIVQFEGGWSILRTKRPGMHALRASMMVFANMAYFMALAVLPLADTTALFFVAPLFITVLSIPVLKESVGIRRIAAVLVGFLGVLIILGPGSETRPIGVSIWVMVLPVVGALAYAMTQVLTRALRMSAKASAMAVYIQCTFIVVGIGFYLVAGDGRFVDGVDNQSLQFLLRAWVWPAREDLWALILLGLMSAVIGYTLSQAYRLGDAATIAPYEYATMPFALFWGWIVFGSWPGLNTGVGIGLIIASGIYVFLRERARKSSNSEGSP